jgi:hypothetical protein
MSTETAVVENPYQPPQAPVADVGINADEGLYVVAPWKFLTLMLGTAGVYSLYWFYKNWSLLNRRHKSYWPVPRAFFAVFFTHALFEEIAARVRRSANAYAWSPSNLATAYVICAIVQTLLSRLPPGVVDARFAAVASISMLAPITFVLYRGQLASNVAEGDPRGTRNDKLTAANLGWLVLGGVWWSLMLLGLFVIITGRVPQ